MGEHYSITGLTPDRPASNTDEALIQMGDWYSEELIPKMNETAAMVKSR